MSGAAPARSGRDRLRGRRIERVEGSARGDDRSTGPRRSANGSKALGEAGSGLDGPLWRRAGRGHGDLQDVVADLDLIPVAEARLAARAQRAAVDDDRVLRAGVRDEVAAGLEGDRGVRARDEPLGIGSTSVLVSPRPMVPPASSKRAASSRSSGRPLKRDRADRQHSAYLSGTKSESGVERFLLRLGRSRPSSICCTSATSEG